VARDDWRLRIELEDRVDTLLERLGFELHDEARELARDLEGHRLAVSHDGDTVFVYADSAAAVDRARQVVESQLVADDLKARQLRVEHWLADEDRWDDEPPQTIEEELVARGYAPWEVRVERETHAEASALADELEAEGYGVVRRFRYLIVGTATREEAEELARRLEGDVEAGGAVVWEVLPDNPFARVGAVFGGLGSSGTPL
jgi:hypothetical protein